MRRFVTRRTAWFALILGTLAAPTAEAQDAATAAVWVAPPPEAGPVVDHPEATRGVERALRAGVTTLIPLEASRQRLRGHALSDCVDSECAVEIARTLNADFVALVTVWTQAGRATAVTVSMVPAEGESRGGDPVRVTDPAELEDAAARATEECYTRYRAGLAGQVVITSTPPGASVEIDGGHHGRTPYRRLIAAGTRNLRVSLEGYEPVERALTVVAREELVVDDLVLEAVGSGPDPDPIPQPSSGPDVALAVVGGILIAGGLAATGVVIGGLVDATAPEHGIVDEGVFAAWLVAAGVGLAVGVPLLAIGLTSGGGGRVTAQLGPGSLTLRGVF